MVIFHHSTPYSPNYYRNKLLDVFEKDCDRACPDAVNCKLLHNLPSTFKMSHQIVLVHTHLMNIHREPLTFSEDIAIPLYI